VTIPKELFCLLHADGGSTCADKLVQSYTTWCYHTLPVPSLDWDWERGGGGGGGGGGGQSWGLHGVKWAGGFILVIQFVAYLWN
jgi:hypothetical protein